jgi:DUF2075 family protein
MIIYHETKQAFIADADTNALGKKLQDAFRLKTGGVPKDSTVWADEYLRFASVLRHAKVDPDIPVAIEYHISAAGRFRIDVLVAGHNGKADNALIIELKAWDWAGLSDVPDLVQTPYQGRPFKNHPCVQARKYKGLILRFNGDVRESGIELHSSAYLFNLHRRKPEPLEDARYADILEESRLFLAGDFDQLREYLEYHVPKKPLNNVIHIIENGKKVPAPELVARVSSMLEGNEEFDLIDEQNEAYNTIKFNLLREKDAESRHVFVVEGGPGTGKSVIAVRLLADMLHEKKMVLFIAPNRAFRETIVENLAHGNRGYIEDGRALLQSSWSFHSSDYSKDKEYEIFIVDEAHRLKDRAHMYHGKNMVEDMVRSARICVFFLDETQRVQWGDIGSVEAIRDAAKKFKAKYHEPFKLQAQYRCNGSTGYLNWLDDVLQIRETGNFENWGDGQYDFRVYDDAADLYRDLKAKNTSNKSRLIAGYSWEWPSSPTERRRGTGTKHVQVDDLALPWNYDGENWATSQDGIEQVGCVHTSQGVEFDWLGVLIGPDLVYRDGKVVGIPESRARTDASLNGWKTALKNAASTEEQEAVLAKVQDIIKSTYKVLLTRGRYGCFVWCADAELREYLKERLLMAGHE